MRPRSRGRLVALEGIDGAGKSTLTKGLVRTLRRRGVRAIARREPADRNLGHLAQEASLRDPWTGAVYFTIDRFLARPALEGDLRHAAVVVTDRSFYSTLAYQGSALGPAGVRKILELSNRATIVPDRVVLLDLPPKVAIERLGHRGPGRGPLERRRILERVARRYRKMARRERWLVLDARRPVAELLRAALDDIAPPGRRARKVPRRPASRERT
ncbi:MAG TPA: dTMP kinase [Thermoplasmata archaeon]|nr:dTMP kinase [Thermoplasmata archaeon]